MTLRFLALVLTAALVAPSAPAEGRTYDRADKPRHDLTVAGKEIGGDTNRFKLYGRVPTYPGKDLRIERKVNSQSFKPWSTDTTSADTGRFSIRVYGGKRGSTICYRVVVPSTPEFRTTRGDRWCIRTAS